MASAKPIAPDTDASARTLLADYRARAAKADTTVADERVWTAMLAEVAAGAEGDLTALRLRAERQAADIGTGFRAGGESEDRRWPLSPLPLLIPEREWRGIADGIAQRANLMEMLLADIYGAQRLVGNGLVPAALLNGSPNFLRPMVGLTPPGGHHLQVYAADLARGPKGDWRVLADHTRNPVGAGYALENRLAMTRVLPGLQSRLHVERLAPFFADLRAGIATACRRSEPRIALLTPGRLNPSYAEQAHLARYLGLLLVEGEDLATYEDRLYLRTIEGFKRVDALWRRIDARLLDPLAFDSHSRIGVAGLIDAIAAGNVVVANTPGAGVLESAAFAAFLPRLSVRMTGEDLRLPNLATWWCGQDREHSEVLGNLDSMVIAPAFSTAPRALGGCEPRLGSGFADADRAALVADMQLRGIDYVGQEIVKLASLPTVGDDGALMPRPYTLRVFAARDANGAWSVMPGGFVRIGAEADSRAVILGEGAYSTDAVVVAERPVEPLTLLTNDEEVAIRRNPGTLPSRVADNLFWLGRYLERAENILALVRGALGGSADVDGGATLGVATAGRLDAMIAASGAAPLGAPLGTAFGDTSQSASVAKVMGLARSIGAGSRERLSADVWRLLDKGLPKDGPLVARASALAERLAALAGLSAESMGRTASWRFLDLGRRLERAVGVCRLLKTFDIPDATADDLALLLDLSSSAISYRQRYPGNLSARAARDLIALDASNPRSLAFQVHAIGEHLSALPRLSDDGMAEAQEVEATSLAATLTTFRADNLDAHAVQGVENRLLALNDLIARRFFLRGGEPLRAPGMTLA